MEEIVSVRSRSDAARRRGARAAVGAIAAALLVAQVPGSRAEPPESRAEPAPRSAMPGVDEVARALAEAMTPRWEGPRVPWPELEERPLGQGSVTLVARHRPLAVHALPGAHAERLEDALDALEVAYDALRGLGLEPPYPDGALGAGPSFDLYLVPEEASGARAAADAPVAWSALDAVTSFGRVDAGVPQGALAACVTEAYADSVLLALDPAESGDARRAMAGFLAHLVTGRFGCGVGVEDAQAFPGRAPLLGAPGEGEGGALFLSRLSRTHDGGTGAFALALFELSRQRTGDLGDLRALPDVPLALERSLERAGFDLRATMIDDAVDRYLDPGGGSLVPRIEPEWTLERGALPAHPGPSREPVEVFGSGYAKVDVHGAPPGSRLRVWLRGEHGVEWSLVAVTLDGEGRERTRVTAPPGTNERRSYLACELDEATSSVLVVVTNLGPPPSRANEGGAHDRRYELVVDLARDGET